MTVTKIGVTDMHTAGEPVRIVTDGWPELSGATILEKRRDMLAHFDHYRHAVMLEPRGHAGMYGVIPVPATHPDAVIGALFMHNDGYSTMCGHATLALGRWLVETGRVAATEPKTRFAVELPCGLVQVECNVTGGRVTATAFDSVPAFVSQAGVETKVPGIGPLQLDIAYGGAFYAILPASRIGLHLHATPLAELTAVAAAITAHLRETVGITHPTEPDLGFLYGTILTDDAAPPEDSWNLCVFADGQVDRSPTGSGVTARMALDHADGRIGVGDQRRFRGPTGIGFDAVILATTPAGVTVRVGGRSSVIGHARFVIEDDDPLAHGFRLGAVIGLANAG